MGGGCTMSHCLLNIDDWRSTSNQLSPAPLAAIFPTYSLRRRPLRGVACEDGW